MLTESQLKEMIPRNKYVSYWHHALEQLLPDYDINTPSASLLSSRSAPMSRLSSQSSKKT